MELFLCSASTPPLWTVLSIGWTEFLLYMCVESKDAELLKGGSRCRGLARNVNLSAAACANRVKVLVCSYRTNHTVQRIGTWRQLQLVRTVWGVGLQLSLVLRTYSDRIPAGKTVIPSFFVLFLGRSRDNTCVRPQPIPSMSFPSMSHPATRRHGVSILRASLSNYGELNERLKTPLQLAFGVRLIGRLISHVVVWKQLHLIRLFVKIRHKRESGPHL
jgi:hypothetical protein